MIVVMMDVEGNYDNENNDEMMMMTIMIMMMMMMLMVIVVVNVFPYLLDRSSPGFIFCR